MNSTKKKKRRKLKRGGGCKIQREGGGLKLLLETINFKLVAAQIFNKFLNICYTGQRTQAETIIGKCSGNLMENLQEEFLATFYIL